MELRKEWLSEWVIKCKSIWVSERMSLLVSVSLGESVTQRDGNRRIYWQDKGEWGEEKDCQTDGETERQERRVGGKRETNIQLWRQEGGKTERSSVREGERQRGGETGETGETEGEGGNRDRLWLWIRFFVLSRKTEQTIAICYMNSMLYTVYIYKYFLICFCVIGS